MAWGTAREHVRVARALEEMPETRRALDAGDLSMSAVRVLVAARDADPSAFPRSETLHHVVHWAGGGPTALPNLLLLCRRHHRMVHRTGGFRMDLTDGRPVFRRPDGSVLSVLEERGPP